MIDNIFIDRVLELTLVDCVNVFRGIPVIGKKVLEVRESLVFSQESFGNLIGMSKNNVSAIERSAVVGMNKSSFRQLAKVLNISVEELRGRIGAKHVKRTGKRVVRVPDDVYEMLKSLAAEDGSSIEKYLEKHVKMNTSSRRISRSPKPESQTEAETHDAGIR